MRQLSKLTRFFIICAAVLTAGILCTVIGVKTGGMEDLDKVAEKYDWIQGDPGERCVVAQQVDEFNAIEFNGNADVYLLGKAFYRNATRMTEDDLLKPTEIGELGPNKVIVIAGDKMTQPAIEVSEGVLRISCDMEEPSGISFDSYEVGWIPKILVCCPMDTLESLDVKGTAGDLNCLGTSWKNAALQMTSGEICMEGVTSGGLSMKLTSGDAEMRGEFLKTTAIEAESGDVLIDTALARAEYGLDLRTDGDITIEEQGRDPEKSEDVPAEVKQTGGPHMINANASSGDIEIHFGTGSER